MPLQSINNEYLAKEIFIQICAYRFGIGSQIIPLIGKFFQNQEWLMIALI